MNGTDSGNISTWSCQARNTFDQPQVSTGETHDRNFRRRLACRFGREIPVCDDHFDALLYQFVGVDRQLLVPSVGPAIINNNLSLLIAQFAQMLLENINSIGGALSS